MKRVNKIKDQIKADMDKIHKVEREKTLVKMMFPLIETQKTIYDAQTTLQALSGFIKLKIEEKVSEFKVQDLKFDLSKEEDSEIKTSILTLIDMLAPENAKDTAGLLERFGNSLAQYSAHVFMKKPMSDVPMEDIIAK
jgi:hypothetical protein